MDRDAKLVIDGFLANLTPELQQQVLRSALITRLGIEQDLNAAQAVETADLLIAEDSK